jgi:hypothetical protein
VKRVKTHEGHTRLFYETYNAVDSQTDRGLNLIGRNVVTHGIIIYVVMILFQWYYRAKCTWRNERLTCIFLQFSCASFGDLFSSLV